MLTSTPIVSIISVLAASVLGACSQFLFQHGATHGKSGLVGFVTNPFILLGMASYITVMVLFTYAFKLGGVVRVLYPLYATTFIWGALIACLVFGHSIQPLHILGMVFLLVGIICMSW